VRAKQISFINISFLCGTTDILSDVQIRFESSTRSIVSHHVINVNTFYNEYTENQ